MTQPFKISSVLILSILTILFSCRQRQEKKQGTPNSNSIQVEKDTTLVNENKTTTISTDIEKLGNILDFKTYKPIKAKYKYVFIDNSGQNKSLSVPGPSDYILEAVLYFDSLTFEKFYNFDRYANYSPPNYNKEDFKFDWLDNPTLNELNNSNKNYHGHPDFFFGSINGRSWYLDKKILIQKSSN